ncbi:MAG: phosphate acyltransferase PlsX [Christensenellales bacterium]|jgi:glycerol-3-phosphate acyltransferase PlsX
MYRIAVDVMGGDNAPLEIVKGCIMALREHEDIALILCGDNDAVSKIIKEQGYSGDRIEIRHAPDVLSMNDAAEAIRSRPDSSLAVAFSAVSSGDAGAIITAGSTGGAMSGAILKLRRIKGIHRPALAPVLPTMKSPVMLIDCGANADCKPQYLPQFAIMGSAYMNKVMGVKEPRVALLNIGTEEGKGNELMREAYGLIKQAPVNFVGNIEGRDIPSGDYDVVVADGFSGNVALKMYEGAALAVTKMLKQELIGSFRTKIGALIVKPALARFKKQMDYSEHGGALLLGVDGGVIKSHGSSGAKAILKSVEQARGFIAGGVVETIKAAISDALIAE